MVSREKKRTKKNEEKVEVIKKLDVFKGTGTSIL
jgi:hypothetical protein